MLKIDIVSGFLGAGKTTFIKRLLQTKINEEKVVLIENEYGEISVDTDILKDTKIEIRELSQGCICCSLVGDFSKALKELISKYNPDRVIIEPSGVGKLSDIVKAISSIDYESALNSLVCLVDCKKAKMYKRNFGEFFIDQIKNAHTVILSRSDIAKDEVIEQAVEEIREINENAILVTTPIATLKDEDLLSAYEGHDVNLDFDEDEHEHHHHHDEDEDDDHECCCHHHDEEECDDHECECHHHHHHDDEDEDEECCCHHHDEEECDDPECECHHHHHHHHHADEVFNSIGIESAKKYNISSLKETLDKLSTGEYGLVVRAKGIIHGDDNKWYLFNLTPEEVEIIPNDPIPMGKIVVIGSHIDEEVIKKLF